MTDNLTKPCNDTGAKKYIQYLPLALVVFAIITGWTNLKGDVQAGGVKVKSIEQMQERHRERIQKAEEAIQELRTQTAVITNNQTQIRDSVKETQQDIRKILEAVKK